MKPAAVWIQVMLVISMAAGCSMDAKSGDSGGNQKVIVVDGSSTVYPVTEAAADEFQKQKPGIKVTVGNSGTGGGFKKFVRGETDISNASRPILKEEIEEAKKHGLEYLELPICFDALTVVVSKENDWVDYLTVDELRKMWDKSSKDKISKWSEIRDGWPEIPFILFGPGTDSGTFDYFTEAINGKAKRSRDDYTASEDDNVLVQGVAGNKYGLGYFGFAYYAAHKEKLKGVPIQWDKGKVKTPVAPSSEGILTGTYSPLSRPLFIYVSKQAIESKPELREFVSFYLANAAALARRKRYVPLPKEAYAICRQRMEKLKVGTAFGGEQEVGLPIQEILKREPK